MFAGDDGFIASMNWYSCGSEARDGEYEKWILVPVPVPVPVAVRVAQSADDVEPCESCTQWKPFDRIISCS